MCRICATRAEESHGKYVVRWQKTVRLSEDMVVYKGESRLAMAPKSGDIRVLPHETGSVALGDVKRAKRRQKTRQIPRRFDLPQSDESDSLRTTPERWQEQDQEQEQRGEAKHQSRYREPIGSPGKLIHQALSSYHFCRL